MAKNKHNIPSFDGSNPSTLTFSVAGSITEEDDQPSRVLKIGEPVDLVVSGFVMGVNHTIDKDGELTRATKIKIDTAHLLQDYEFEQK